jgi:hypothetical protein
VAPRSIDGGLTSLKRTKRKTLQSESTWQQFSIHQANICYLRNPDKRGNQKNTGPVLLMESDRTGQGHQDHSPAA